jgi:ABC-2 type transport system ATP-binding protein
MTSTGIEIERTSTGAEGRPVSRALSLSVGSGEISGIPGANSAGKSAAVEIVPPSRHHDGGQIRVRGFDPAEQRAQVRHLVNFRPRVL